MTKRQKLKVIGELIDKYKLILHLTNWEIHYCIDDSISAAASIRVDAPYTFAKITVNSCSFKEPEDIDDIICHELCHCLTQDLYLYCIDFLNGKFHSPLDIEDKREYLTETISKLVRGK